MRDLFGVRAWRRKPMRERVLPWPLYALMSVISFGCGLYLMTSPDGLHNALPVAVLFLVMAPALLYLAVVSARVRR